MHKEVEAKPADEMLQTEAVCLTVEVKTHKGIWKAGWIQLFSKPCNSDLVQIDTEFFCTDWVTIFDLKM